MSGSGWHLGSTGVVRTPGHRAYAMTVMTEGSADDESGIALVETIARHVNAGLTIGDASPRPVDTVTCVTTRPGVTWAAAGELLGVNDVALLQSINGGEAASLSGQRVCAP